MKYRKMGTTGLESSIIGLGTGRLASLSSGLSAGEGIKLIHLADDLGVNLIDTADSYGQGESETLIGRALVGRRNRFLIASKAGFCFSRGLALAAFLKPVVAFASRRFRGIQQRVAGLRAQASQLGILRKNFAAPYIERSLEGSLRRLRCDYLDLFFLHDPPVEALQDETLLATLANLQRAGKIRFLGVSSNQAPVLEAALHLPQISCLQTATNPACSDAWTPLLPRILARRIGLIGNQVYLGGRLLASDLPPEPPPARRRLERVSGRSGLTPEQALFRFALQQPAVCSVLTGTTKAAHLRQNVADAILASDLTHEEMATGAGS